MADDEETTDEQANDEQATDEAEESNGAEAKDSSSDEDENSEGQSTSEEAAANDDPDFGLKEDEPANDVQMKYLEPLAEAQGEEIPDDMSEADAANKINEMQENAAS